MEKIADYTPFGGKKIKYNPNAPCVCCGLPVTGASMGGTIICPWCDCGVNRNGERIYLKYGPSNPHPAYVAYYRVGETIK